MSYSYHPGPDLMVFVGIVVLAILCSSLLKRAFGQRFTGSWRVISFIVVSTGFYVGASLLWGRGALHEFSPDTLQYRAQSEVLWYATGVPLHRSPPSFYRSPLVEYLIDEGYWSPRQTAEPQWIFMSRWNQQWRDGQTQLYRYTRQNADEWVNWSEDNPVLARVLWPKVLSILRRGITGGYAAHVMFLAKRSESVDEFRDSVNVDPELQAKGIHIEEEASD